MVRVRARAAAMQRTRVSKAHCGTPGGAIIAAAISRSKLLMVKNTDGQTWMVIFRW